MIFPVLLAHLLFAQQEHRQTKDGPASRGTL